MNAAVDKAAAALDYGAVKTLMSTAQILVSIGVNLEVNFPEPYGTLSKAFSFINVEFFKMECTSSLRSYYAYVLLTSLVPLGFALLGLLALAQLLRALVVVIGGARSNDAIDARVTGRSTTAPGGDPSASTSRNSACASGPGGGKASRWRQRTSRFQAATAATRSPSTWCNCSRWHRASS